MLFSRLRKVLTSCLLSILLLSGLVLTSCAPQPPSPYEQAQQQSTEKNAPPAVAKIAEQGSEFNAFFPDSAQGLERVFVQEKKGFAEAKLKKDGKEIAMLSISDTISTPTAADKYQSSTQKIRGYPAMEIGSTQTGVLVAQRYQVKVISRDPSFTATDRQTWMQKFDLEGLARLKS
jgi:hypothetical protein